MRYVNEGVHLLVGYRVEIRRYGAKIENLGWPFVLEMNNLVIVLSMKTLNLVFLNTSTHLYKRLCSSVRNAFLKYRGNGDLRMI